MLDSRKSISFFYVHCVSNTRSRRGRLTYVLLFKLKIMNYTVKFLDTFLAAQLVYIILVNLGSVG